MGIFAGKNEGMEKGTIKSRRPREDSAFWALQLEGQESSELSIKAFCASQGLSAASFYKWRKRLDQEKARGKALFSPIALESKPLGNIVVELPGGVLLRFVELPPVGYLRSLSSMFSGG